MASTLTRSGTGALGVLLAGVVLAACSGSTPAPTTTTAPTTTVPSGPTTTIAPPKPTYYEGTGPLTTTPSSYPLPWVLQVHSFCPHSMASTFQVLNAAGTHIVNFVHFRGTTAAGQTPIIPAGTYRVQAVTGPSCFWFATGVAAP